MPADSKIDQSSWCEVDDLPDVAHRNVFRLRRLELEKGWFDAFILLWWFRATSNAVGLMLSTLCIIFITRKLFGRVIYNKKVRKVENLIGFTVHICGLRRPIFWFLIERWWAAGCGAALTGWHGSTNGRSGKYVRIYGIWNFKKFNLRVLLAVSDKYFECFKLQYFECFKGSETWIKARKFNCQMQFLRTKQ